MDAYIAQLDHKAGLFWMCEINVEKRRLVIVLIAIVCTHLFLTDHAENGLDASSPRIANGRQSFTGMYALETEV